MADSKPLDRARPFARINDEAFVAKQAPDGFGVTCGCQRPEDFGEVDKEFEKFIDDNLPAPILRILRTIRDVAKTVGDVAQILALLLVFLGPAFLAVVGLVVAINAMITEVLDAIDAGARVFFKTIAKKLLPRAVRTIPQWVPVLRGASNQSVTKDQIIEVQGIVTRSFGNPIDVPFFQWRHWFAWNIQIRPEAKYARALSPAANPPNQDGFTAGESPLSKDGSFEIQWDAGALFSPEEAAAYEAGFPDVDMPKHDGPMMNPSPAPLRADWCWPMAGMEVWAAGRWVYDCSRVTGAANPQMCAMINPAKAIATARFQAVKFAGNDAGVPAIQFMFVASKRGGYINYDTINDQDYEFILDLPPPPVSDPVYPIGHTGNVTANTIVMRPRLLKSVVTPELGGLTAIDPIVEFIRPEGAQRIPTQVKVRIPLKALSPAVAAAGCILSLGWSDPARQQAAKVKRCKVLINGFSGRVQIRDSGLKKFRSRFPEAEQEMRRVIAEQISGIKILGFSLGAIPGLSELVQKMVDAAVTALLDGLQDIAPLESEEWLLRFGVNGVWRSHYIKDVKTGAGSFVPPLDFGDLFLGDDDELAVAIQGVEFDPVGDMMRAAHLKRVITDGPEVPWARIVTPDPDPAIARTKRRNMVFQYVLKIMFDTTGDKLSLGFENSPLGIIDPDATNKGLTADNNPLLMKGLAPQTLQVRRTARFARAVGDQLILAEDGALRDYDINYSIQVDNAI